MVALSAILMMKKKENTGISDFSNHPAYKLVKFFVPVYPKLIGHNFFVSNSHVQEELKKEENKHIVLKRKGLVYATPLFLCLAIVETSDVMFAFDSVPAVIAVSKDPFIVYSCMIFAILGLRSMYFILDASECLSISRKSSNCATVLCSFQTSSSCFFTFNRLRS